MIQSYLKTGMVFYRNREDQHFRRDCCQSNFCQYTDKIHFPSFQIYSEMYVSTKGVNLYLLDDTVVHTGGTIATDFYHHVDGGVIISHDFRDAIAYHASVPYNTCMYMRLQLYDTAGAEYQFWYSEAFMICDCDIIGAGDGINLFENGWFEDWDLAANPNNTPDGWFVANNDATNYVDNRPPPAGIHECQLISDNTQPITVYQDILTVGKWYVATLDIINVTNGALGLTDIAIAIIETWNTTGSKNFVFQAATTFIGFIRQGITNITFTNVRIEEFVGFAFCDRITLNWWADCDWDGMIYQYGYRNNLILSDPDKVILQIPSEEITLNTNERLGEKLPSDIITKKIYRFKIRIPEYLWNALIRLPAYGSEMPNFHAWITMPIHNNHISIFGAPIIDVETSQTAPMSEVAILGEWDKGNCMNTLTVEFVDNHEYPVVATNCCDDEDVSEV